MNELTKEASKQTVLEAISRLWYQHKGDQRKSRRTPYKPLKHDFERYITDVYGSDCEILDDDYQKHLDSHDSTYEDRNWWEQLNKDMASGKQPF